MNPTVFKGASPPPASEGTWTAERCFIVETWNHSSDPGVSLTRARVSPGIATARHALAVDERYLIESGKGRVEIGGLVSDITPGDVVLIPAGTPQRITNRGEEDLVFLCVCTPRFEPAHYEDHETNS